MTHPLAWWDTRQLLLRRRWRAITARFDARQRRERMALLLCAGALALWVCDQFWIGPAYQRAREAGVRQQIAQQALDALRAQMEQQRLSVMAQDRQLRGELADWRQRVQTGSEGLRRHEDTLVRADHMVALLERMVPRDGRLQVRELRSLGAGELALATPGGAAPASVPAAAAEAGAEAPGLYRHGVELVLEGAYPDLVAYLQALEALPQRVLWGGLSMKVEQHPRVVLTVRLYTLSLDRGWLEL